MIGAPHLVAQPATSRASQPAQWQRAAADLAGSALQAVGRSRMGSVAYDTGFVARLHSVLGADPLVGGALQYLRATQSAQGWWGSSFPSLYDRALSTLSAACGLASAGEAKDAPALGRAVEYLAATLPRLKDERELVGSDLLLPPLLKHAAELGLAVDPRWYPHRGVGRVAKALYGRVFYSGHPVGHLLEILGDNLDAQRAVENLTTSPSGSLMCAPSTTAFAIERAGRASPAAITYLRSSANADGGLKHFGPYELMEAAYVLYALRRTPLFSNPSNRTPLRMLREAWGPNGVGFSREFPAVDLDDSVLAALVINASGERVSPDFLDAYVSREYFLCYLADRRGAVAPNLHAIEALRELRHPRAAELTEVALGFVRGRQNADGSFADHYSLSPYYPTWHAIEALSGADDAMAQRAAEFLASRLQDDGSFAGAAGGRASAESAAYAVLGMCAWSAHAGGELQDEIARAAAWLFAHRDDAAPAEWVAKVLYAPTTMARAAVAGALSAAAQAVTGSAGISLSPTRLAGAQGLPLAPQRSAQAEKVETVTITE